MEKQKHSEPARAKYPLLNFLSLIASAAAFGAAIWIVVPAPIYEIWLLSVAASEWSLALSALALGGIAGALIFGRGKTRAATIFLGSVAFLISLYPVVSAFAAAQKHNVPLSPRRYAAGFFGQEKQIGKETFTFAEVGGKRLELDVYAPPPDVAKNGAAVIVVHGGSWNAGTRSDFPRWNQMLAANGYTVFDIDYRLAPQPNYLTATGDVKCAVGWVKKRAARFGIAPAKIVLLGRSAGGHLALLAAYTANDARIASSCADDSETVSTAANDESVRGVVSLYAPADLLWSYDNPANRRVIDGQKTLRQFLGGSPHESAELRERFLLASPGSHVKRGTTPTLLIHGGQDQLVRSENMYRLAERLTEANVPHKTLFLSYAQHGFDYNFNGWGAQIVESVLLDFLRENTTSVE